MTLAYDPDNPLKRAVDAFNERYEFGMPDIKRPSKLVVAATAASLLALAGAVGWYAPEIHERFFTSDAKFCAEAVNYADGRCWGKNYPLRNR